jgi:hypothetical protein
MSPPRYSFHRILGKFSSTFPMLSGVLQRSTFRPSLFRIVINDLHAKTHFLNFYFLLR